MEFNDYRKMEPAKYWGLPSKRTDKVEKIQKALEKHQYYYSPKEDGEWARLSYGKDGDVLIQSRNISTVTKQYGDKTELVPHIYEALIEMGLPEYTVLLGELYYPNKPSSEVGKILRCKPPKAKERQSGSYGYLHYYIFDILCLGGADLSTLPAEKRFKTLESVKSSLLTSPYISFAQYIPVNDYTTLEKAFNEAQAKGQEGLVLINGDAVYEPGKRTAWNSIKIKAEESIDAVLIEPVAPVREYTGKEITRWSYWENTLTGEKEKGTFYGVPNYEAVTKYYFNGWAAGFVFGYYNEEMDEVVPAGQVSSGFSDEMLSKAEEYMGKAVELRCMERYPNGVLRHPLFNRVRDDLNIEDCTIEKI